MKPTIVLALLAGGCFTAPADVDPDAGLGSDGAEGDAASPRCDPEAPFTSITPLSTGGRFLSSLSPDELTGYFHANPGGTTVDIFVATRPSSADAFGSLEPSGASTDTGDDYEPGISHDEKTLVFHSNMNGTTRLQVAVRSSPLVDFGAASPLGGVGAPLPGDADAQGRISADGQEVWFISNRSGGAGGYDLYSASRSGSGFGAAARAATLSSSDDEERPVLAQDGLTLYFSSGRPGGAGSYDIWMATRESPGAAFSAPGPVPGVINSPAYDTAVWISPDGCRIYLGSDRSGASEYFVAERQP